MIKSDVIIVGAGPVGCVLAERISSQLKLNCLIIEKRNHIGGNCYDEYNSKGLLYHKYGPHYLRFKNKLFIQSISLTATVKVEHLCIINSLTASKFELFNFLIIEFSPSIEYTEWRGIIVLSA